MRWFVTRRKRARRAYPKRAESGETWIPKRVRSARASFLNEREKIPVDRPGVRGAHGVGKALIGLQGHRVQRFGAERSRVRIRNDLVALQLGRFSVLGVARP